MGHDDTAVPAVEQAVDEVVDAARSAGKLVAMAVGSVAERDRFAGRGASWFVVGSDQSLLRQGAAAIARRT
jgi:2-keto-3-deoxy-L-rhamnonate aldolase RhmA